MDETTEPQGEAGAPGPGGEGAPAPGPRPVSLAAVAGAVILIGLVAYAVYRRGHPSGSAPPPGAAAPTAPATGPESGTAISAPVPIHLTPEASIVAERYRCICGCADPLNVCTCTKTPGSRDMRQYVQQLVNDGKTAPEIDALMVARYGDTVLLSKPAPRPGAKATASPKPGTAPSPPRRPVRRTTGAAHP